MTTFELQLAIAKKLPELIEAIDMIPTTVGTNRNDTWKVFRHVKTLSPVFDWEWDYLVNQILLTLDLSSKVSFLNTLRQSLSEGKKAISDFDLISSTWQQRAESLHKIGVI